MSAQSLKYELNDLKVHISKVITWSANVGNRKRHSGGRKVAFWAECRMDRYEVRSSIHGITHTGMGHSSWKTLTSDPTSLCHLVSPCIFPTVNLDPQKALSWHSSQESHNVLKFLLGEPSMVMQTRSHWCLLSVFPKHDASLQKLHTCTFRSD